LSKPPSKARHTASAKQPLDDEIGLLVDCGESCGLDSQTDIAEDFATVEQVRLLLATSPGPLRRFNLAHPKVLILQEGLFAFSFPY